MASDLDPTDKVYGMYEGVVVDNVDPLKLYRVRVRIPGMIDDPGSGWILPSATFGGGGSHRGGASAPPKDATVTVFFLGGDRDAPRYMAGHWGMPDGKSEAPGPAGGFARVRPTGEPGAPEEITPEEATQIHTVFESEQWILVFDDRPAPKGGARLLSKKSGDGIELGGGGNNLEIRVSALMALIVDGTLRITGGSVSINDRVVAVSSKPIT